MTDPYGTDPRSQPQGLGTPGSQGPQFIPPGAPGQYGPGYGPPQGTPSYGPPPQAYGQQAQPVHGQPVQPAYGQPGPYGAPQQPYAAPLGQSYQPPYGQGYPPPGPPAPRNRSSSTVLVVVVLVALIAGISLAASQLYAATNANPVTQATPTRTITRAQSVPASATGRPTGAATAGNDTCVSGDKITTASFVAIVPANWSCDGDDGDISISSTRNDAIWVKHDAGSTDEAGDCQSWIDGLGTISPLPQESWGGKPALAFQASDQGDIYGVRCAVAGGQTWYLMYFPLDPKDDAIVRADVTKVMSTWVWK